jgi:sialate O-acetylesterase
MLWKRNLLLSLLLCAGIGQAAVRLAGPFVDHIVLQQGVPVPVWGTGPPGEIVTVKVAGQDVTATVDSQGKWMLQLAPMKASYAFQMFAAEGRGAPFIQGPADTTGGSQDIAEVNDVEIGDVWLFAGPSATNLRSVMNSTLEIDCARYPWVHVMRGIPSVASRGQWVFTSPETAREYTATAYYFARELYEAAKTPIAVIDISGMGGSVGSYKEMIASLAPYAIRGVIWDQSESAATDASQQAMQSLIQDLRKALGQGDLPFVYAPPVEAQLQDLSLPKAATVSTVDLAEVPGAPAQKRAELGRRLAESAQALTH